jgi:hypothetical protein
MEGKKTCEKFNDKSLKTFPIVDNVKKVSYKILLYERGTQRAVQSEGKSGDASNQKIIEEKDKNELQSNI